MYKSTTLPLILIVTYLCTQHCYKLCSSGMWQSRIQHCNMNVLYKLSQPTDYSLGTSMTFTMLWQSRDTALSQVCDIRQCYKQVYGDVMPHILLLSISRPFEQREREREYTRDVPQQRIAVLLYVQNSRLSPRCPSRSRSRCSMGSEIDSTKSWIFCCVEF